MSIQSTEVPDLFRDALGAMEKEVYDCNVANGWFDDARTFGDDIALLHSEVSEMFEAYRDHQMADATAEAIESITGEPAKLPKPEGVGSEAADILIRLFDTAFRHDIDLAGEFVRKMAFNRTRGYKHGGKRI